MTAKTSQHLADVLRAAGFEQLAVRAEADEFHEFLSPHATPEMYLAGLLAQIVKRGPSEREQMAAHNIRQRLINGEFDASDEESEEWAKSAEGQAVFNELVGGKKQ